MSSGTSHPIGLAVSGNVLYVSDNSVDGIYELNAATGADNGFFYDLGASEPDFLAAVLHRARAAHLVADGTVGMRLGSAAPEG